MTDNSTAERVVLTATQKIWSQWHSDLLSAQTLEEHLRLPLPTRKARKPTSAREALGGIDFYIATGICRAFSVRSLSSLWSQYDAAKITMEEEVFFTKLSSIYFDNEKFRLLREAFEATTMDNAPRLPVVGIDDEEDEETDFESEEEEEEEEQEQEEEEEEEEEEEQQEQQQQQQQQQQQEKDKKDEKVHLQAVKPVESDDSRKVDKVAEPLEMARKTNKVGSVVATEINSVEGNTDGASLIALPKQRSNKSPAQPGRRSSLNANNTNAPSQKKRGRRSTSPDTRIQAQKAGLGKSQQNRKGKDSLPGIQQQQQQTGADSLQLPNINSVNEPETDSCLEEKQELPKVDTVLVLPPPPKSYKDAYAPHRGNAPSNKKIFKSPPPKRSNASQNYIEGCTAAFSLPRNKILEAIAPRGKGKTKSTLSIRELSFTGFFMSDSGLSGLAAALSTRNSKNGKAAMPNLKSLSVADNGLTDASSVSITQILNHCPRLTKLDVSSNAKLGFNVARALVAHNILNGASQGSKSTSKKGELPVLTSPLSILEMSGCSKMAKEYVLTIRSLMTRPKHTRPKFVMRELDVSYCNLGDKEGQALCQIIRRWPRAKKINIGYNMFGPRTGLSLSSALQKHKGLDEIIASKNNFGDDAGVAIAFAIAVNASIRVFELEWCGLGPNAAAAMADALMMSPTIIKLNVSHNPIGPQGAATLVKAASVAENVHAEHSRLAKLQFIQQEKEKELAKKQNKHNKHKNGTNTQFSTQHAT